MEVFDLEEFRTANGYCHARLLSSGKVLAVSRMTFGNYRLVTGTEHQVLDGY